jgi:hypothetical protein
MAPLAAASTVYITPVTIAPSNATISPSGTTRRKISDPKEGASIGRAAGHRSGRKYATSAT